MNLNLLPVLEFNWSKLKPFSKKKIICFIILFVFPFGSQDMTDWLLVCQMIASIHAESRSQVEMIGDCHKFSSIFFLFLLFLYFWVVLFFLLSLSLSLSLSLFLWSVRLWESGAPCQVRTVDDAHGTWHTVASLLNTDSSSSFFGLFVCLTVWQSGCCCSQ